MNFVAYYSKTDRVILQRATTMKMSMIIQYCGWGWFKPPQMSLLYLSSGTHRENSTWTPKFTPANEKIFRERMALIKKWYAAWNESQRWTLLEFILKQLKDDQLSVLHDLLHPVIPTPDHDFTRVLPRHICLKIFSLLDPQSLCRAAQVCWYWKHLAECNELWQRKCLKLNWFLPSPPHEYDSSVWKRHYIACVCQLHWHPPQLPSEPSDEDSVDGDGGLDLEATMRERKRRLIPRHPPFADQTKRPWRDPDKYPKDTHFKYDDGWIGNTLYNLSYPPPMSLTQSTPNFKLGTRSQALSPPAPPPDVPPPSSILHPTLLEKMRLGSPSQAHRHLSTINSTQSNNTISETLYGLHDTAPFPRLPPYYVHHHESSSGLESNDTQQYNPRIKPLRGSQGTSVGGSSHGSNTPSSTKQTKGYQSSKPRIRADSGASSLRKVRVHPSNLTSKPWTLPSDDDG